DAGLRRELLLGEVPAAVGELELERIAGGTDAGRGLAQELGVLREAVDRAAPADAVVVLAQARQLVAATSDIALELIRVSQHGVLTLHTNGIGQHVATGHPSLEGTSRISGRRRRSRGTSATRRPR